MNNTPSSSSSFSLPSDAPTRRSWGRVRKRCRDWRIRLPALPWLLDHGDGYAQPAAAITSAVRGRTINGHSAGDLTRDDVLDNITLYWVTNTAISSARLYWENKVNLYLPADVSIPAAITVFPGESFQAPRSWAERGYHKLIYFHQADKGGHFAAWEQPQTFSEEIRAAFRPLRSSI